MLKKVSTSQTLNNFEINMKFQLQNTKEINMFTANQQTSEKEFKKLYFNIIIHLERLKSLEIKNNQQKLFDFKGLHNYRFNDILWIMDPTYNYKFLTRIRMESIWEHWPHILTIKYMFIDKEANGYVAPINEPFDYSGTAYRIFVLNINSAPITKLRNSDLFFYCADDYINNCLKLISKANNVKKLNDDYTKSTLIDGYSTAVVIGNRIEYNIEIKYEKISLTDKKDPVTKLIPNIKITSEDNLCKEESTFISLHDTNRNTKPFKCLCKKGYTGYLCDKNIKCINCRYNLCNTDNKCDLCLAGFSGDYCAKKSCQGLNMCKNGGTCTDSGGTRSCRCDLWSEGDYCEKLKCTFTDTKESVEKNHCKTCFTNVRHHVCNFYTCSYENYCQNNAKCQCLNNICRCICIPGTQGVFCEQIEYIDDLNVVGHKNNDKEDWDICRRRDNCMKSRNSIWCLNKNNLRWVFCEYGDTQTYKSSKSYFVSIIVTSVLALFILTLINIWRKRNDDHF